VNGLSLLNGNYDEEESANSFAQALQEWRNQNKPAKMSPRNQPVCTGMKGINSLFVTNPKTFVIVDSSISLPYFIF
jgi:hypothetical protein